MFEFNNSNLSKQNPFCDTKQPYYLACSSVWYNFGSNFYSIVYFIWFKNIVSEEKRVVTGARAVGINLISDAKVKFQRTQILSILSRPVAGVGSCKSPALSPAPCPTSSTLTLPPLSMAKFLSLRLHSCGTSPGSWPAVPSGSVSPSPSHSATCSSQFQKLKPVPRSAPPSPFQPAVQL